MSRWLGSVLHRRDLRVELRPDSVRVVRQTAFPRAQGVPARPVPVERESGTREGRLELWRGAVDALALALREQRAHVGGVELVLSDHFLRYLLIPWSEALVGDRERQSFAQLGFRDLYGAVADTWDLCLDEQPAGRNSLACAVDRALASSVREVIAAAGGRLVAMVPSLADCINRHRAALKAPEFCFVAAEPGRVSIAFHSRSGWQAVRSRRIDGLLPETLPTLLKQEAVMGGLTEGGVLYVCAEAMPDTTPFALPGWRLAFFADGGLARNYPSTPLVTAAS